MNVLSPLYSHSPKMPTYVELCEIVPPKFEIVVKLTYSTRVIDDDTRGRGGGITEVKEIALYFDKRHLKGGFHGRRAGYSRDQ